MKTIGIVLVDDFATRLAEVLVAAMAPSVETHIITPGLVSQHLCRVQWSSVRLSLVASIGLTPATYGKGIVAVVSAGTSDIPVAEEAVVTAEMMGNEVEHFYDVGVAGIHRLLANREALTRARVVIVCAGMEGALPSVVGGLVGVPVIAVPTSIGYGASFGGLAALLTMLNSCSAGVVVVNIDSGFKGAYVAAMIARGTQKTKNP